jgi:biopolymer transport protein ExbD
MAKTKTKRQRTNQKAEGDMTPMIDVVFQLLIFFIFSIKPEDKFAHLDVFRPAPDPNAVPDEQPETITVQITDKYIFINDKAVSPKQLEAILITLGSYSKTQTILIKCDRASYHESLITVLDKCALAGLNNLNIVTM